MRFRRIISPESAIYHCMSRTVNGEAFFNKREKEVLRKMIAQVADFSGVEVLTYCVMSNHFHVLARVIQPAEPISDAELLRRFTVLYPNPTDYQAASASDVERILAQGGEAAESLRSQLMARMANVSEFMKTLKQRFSIWFNKSHDRFGPVWSDRFKSVLVEGKGFALQTVAAYIDLNPVRAGLVEDPKDYRFCGYAEAVAASSSQKPVLAGIRFLFAGEGELSIKEALQSYRQLLFGKGSASAAGRTAISREDALRVLENEDGELPVWTVLRCRVRYFTEGVVLGSEAFVAEYIRTWQQMRGRKNPSKVKPVAGCGSSVGCLNGSRGGSPYS